MNARNGALVNEVEAPVLTVDEQRQQLDRILRSDVFKAARGLQRFLEYVGSKTLAGLSDEVKEYSIGTEVFGRPADYDPRIDTVVRVQALRVREKLREYYEGEGAADEILLAIPKGHYVPFFTRRTSPASLESLKHSATEMPGSHPETIPTKTFSGISGKGGSRNKPQMLTLAAVAVICLAIGFVVSPVEKRLTAWGNSSMDSASAASLTVPARPGLWADLLADGSGPMVAYSNDVFLETESTDLLRQKGDGEGNLGATARPDLASRLSTNPRLLVEAGPVSFNDTYTGTGEVMGVYYLMRMLGKTGSAIAVKRSRLVTTEDLSHHDLIFLGSTKENALLAGLPLVQDFVFEWPSTAGMWKGRIRNLHPQPGEANVYQIERDPQTHVLRTDYAMISFLPGLAPNRKIVVLAGMTTLGTQAAAEFATSDAGMAELAKHFGTGPAGSNEFPPFFQALLKIDIMRGEILNVSYVTGHAIRPQPLQNNSN